MQAINDALAGYSSSIVSSSSLPPSSSSRTRSARKPPKPGKDWFSRLFGFKETSYDVTKRWLRVKHPSGHPHGPKILRSLANGREFRIGRFEAPTLGELRARCEAPKVLKAAGGRLSLSVVCGDVAIMHCRANNQHATFQVASQFNCLEFTHPSCAPEDGVTGYFNDRTQGPACSIACAAATLYRNYFLPVPLPNADGSYAVQSPIANANFELASAGDLTRFAPFSSSTEASTSVQKGGAQTVPCPAGPGTDIEGSCEPPSPPHLEYQEGQTRELMLNLIAGLAAAVCSSGGRFFRTEGGYTLATDLGLTRLNELLAKLPQGKSGDVVAAATGSQGPSREALKGALRVGVHSDVQVTCAPWGRPFLKASFGGGSAARNSAAVAAAEEEEEENRTVTQVFSSACAVNYSRNSPGLWEPLSRIVLEATYEATLYAAVEAMLRKEGRASSRVVYLTLVGGGVFGNAMKWIVDAIREACYRFVGHFI